MIYNNLILNSKIWNQLEVMVKNNTLPHAFIFHGPEGSGKEAHAIELAMLLNAQQDIKNINFQNPNINLIIPLPREKAINKKADSLKAISDKSLDLLIEMKKQKMKNPYNKIKFEKATSILINSIRDIKKNIHTPINNESDYIVHLIFEAEKLCAPKTEPGNALLKILEEPPKKNIFILVTSEKNKLIDTIQSRCCEFYFPQLSKNDIIQYLNKYGNCETQEIDLIIKLSNNNMTNILEMIELDGQIQILKNDAINFIKNLIKDQGWEKNVKKIESLMKTKREMFKVFIRLVIFILNDLEKIKNKNRDCVILTNITSTKDLNYIDAINIIEQYYTELNKNLNPSIGLFSMAVEMKKTMYKNK